jgi:hypothetical protein
MTERLIDDLGRALAGPVRRRRLLGVFAGAFATLAVPGLRPRMAFAHHCGEDQKVCQNNPDSFGNPTHFCCGADQICCHGPEGYPTTCCDPCLGESCGSDGYCQAGTPVCSNQCCARLGFGDCNVERNICCRSGERYAADPQCAQRRRRDAEGRTRQCYDNLPNSGQGLSAAEAAFSAGGSRWLRCLGDNNDRWRRDLERCPRGCTGGSARESATTVRRRSASAEESSPRRVANAERSSGGSLSTRVLRARLRAAAPRLRKTLNRLEQALEVQPSERSRERLAAALAAHRDEILRLQRRLARGSGGRPQRLAVATLDQQAAGLNAYRRAALAETLAKAHQETLRGNRLMGRAAQTVVLARRALGCGKVC